MKQTLFVTLGTISLGLGILGIFLPILPTTPFLLLTATLYFNSSKKLYSKLMGNKHLGPYIKSFREDKSIPLQAKIISVSLLWLTIGYSIFFVVHLTILKVLLGAIAIAVTIHILSFKTKE